MLLGIRGGRIIDPSQGLDMVGDLLVREGRIASVGQRAEAESRDWLVLDAQGCVVCPGLIDLHCHLREPGDEDKETIATGAAAAVAGGFTTVCCMANTRPPLDSAAALDFVRQRAAEVALARVLPLGAVTKGRAGKELSEMAELAAAGAVGFSDDGSPIASGRLMYNALLYSRLAGRPISVHCEDPDLAQDGVMNEGPVSARLGLKGVPAAAEAAMLARDILLAELTGGRLHAAHISTAASLRLIRQAKARRLPVTAEVTPHHLAMTEDLVAGSWPTWPGSRASHLPYDTHTKVNPPLRQREDVDALLEGLKDGAIDAIATDHAPHTLTDKLCEYGPAAFGISGLDTALAGLLTTLVETGKLDLYTVITKLTLGPAKVLGLDLGSLRVGATADITVFDPALSWTVTPEALASKGKNTPFLGETLRGKVVATVREGRIVYGRERFI